MTDSSNVEKIYSVQFRRFGDWLACKGTEPKASYRVVAITPSWSRARLMAATKCVDPAALAQIEAIASASLVPNQPVQA